MDLIVYTNFLGECIWLHEGFYSVHVVHVDQLISEGVQVKSSIWEFRMRSSQGSCICTCRG